MCCVTEHDGAVSRLVFCLHSNAESRDDLEASRWPLEFVEALELIWSMGRLNIKHMFLQVYDLYGLERVKRKFQKAGELVG